MPKKKKQAADGKKTKHNKVKAMTKSAGSAKTKSAKKSPERKKSKPTSKSGKIQKPTSKSQPKKTSKAENKKNTTTLKSRNPITSDTRKSKVKEKISSKSPRKASTSVSFTRQTNPINPISSTQTNSSEINEEISLTELDLKSKLPQPFIEKQRKKLEELRDALINQMADVAQDSLRTSTEGGGGAAFGQHMGDAGSDAYEKDFALSLLSKEQNSLYEILDALNRIKLGTYGVCEKSGKEIPRNRLEAIPWARYTVECQKEIEKTTARTNRWDSTPQFMDSIEFDDEAEEEESEEESRSKTPKE